MTNQQFFLSWSRQVNAPSMQVQAAHGDEFILANGHRVYDFTSTSFQTSFGHSCDSIKKRIHHQLDEMPIASPKAIFDLKQQVSSRLLDLLNISNPAANSSGSDAGKIFYTVSGSESVENALKIARHFTGRTIVLARKKSYHGASLGSMSVSGDWRSDPHVNFSEGTVRIPEPTDDPEAVATEEIIQRTGPDKIAAVIVETISGVNGVAIPPVSWWESLQRICRQYGILLICDEVLSGFGRTGPAFAFHHFGVQPDLVCLSKAITGGYVPFGAVWVSDDIGERYDNDVLACGLTNYGHPLGLAALDAVIDMLTDSDFCQHKKSLEHAFSKSLQNLQDHHASVVGFRHRGLLAAIDFRQPLPPWQTFLEAGLYVVIRDQMLILAPPFISTSARLTAAIGTLDKVLDAL